MPNKAPIYCPICQQYFQVERSFIEHDGNKKIRKQTRTCCNYHEWDSSLIMERIMIDGLETTHMHWEISRPRLRKVLADHVP